MFIFMNILCRSQLLNSSLLKLSNMTCHGADLVPLQHQPVGDVRQPGLCTGLPVLKIDAQLPQLAKLRNGIEWLH